MRKKYFTLFISVFILFIAIFSLALPNKAEAIPPEPTGLSSEALCTGDNDEISSIDFNWVNISSDYKYRIKFTGLSQEYIETTNNFYRVDASSFPVGVTVQWSLSQCDRSDGWDHGCSDQNFGYTSGPNANTIKCPPDGSVPTPTPIPSYNCDNRPTKPQDCTKFDLCVGPFTPGQGGIPNCSGPVQDNYCPFDSNGSASGGVVYCAYNEPVSCDKEGITCADPIDDGKGTCCTGLICDIAGAATNGICKKPTGSGPGQNLCIVCPNGYTWDEEQELKKCRGVSGQDPVDGQQIACTESQICEPGIGCVDKNKQCTVAEDCLSGICIDGYCKNDGLTSFMCKKYSNGHYRCQTAIGTIETNPEKFVQNVLRILLGLAGGILLILIIINGYKIMTSQGDPEKLKDAKEGIIAAIAGILLIIFSLSILQLITTDIIGIPGFG